MRFPDLRLALVVFVITGLAATAAPAQDWPMWRHDAQRTAAQSQPVGIAVPADLWSLPVGGKLAASDFLVGDADRDGALEVVLLRGGRAVARRFDGTLVWATEPLALTGLSALTDFDADGRPEVWAVSWSSGVFALDGMSGAIVWRTPPDSGLRYLSPLPVDVDGDGRNELYMPYHGCGSGGRWGADVYSFPTGWDGAVAVPLDLSEHDAWCGGGTFGDIDGDGALDLVTLAWASVVVYDPRTGAPVLHSAAFGDLPWGIGDLTIRDIDRDGRDEILIATDWPSETTSSRRLLRLDEEAGALVLTWILEADRQGVHHFPRPAAADLVPGGPLEIATSIFDPATGRWRLLVIAGDSPTPDPVLELPDRALLAIADIDGDGVPELLVQDAASGDLGGFDTIQALRVNDGAPWTVSEAWSRDAARLPLEPSPWGRSEAPVRFPADGTSGPKVVLLADRDRDGRGDAVLGVGAGAADVERVYGVDRVPAGLRLLDDGVAARAIVSSSDGGIELLDRGLSLLNDSATPLGLPDLFERNYLAETPTLQVVGTSAGPRLVVVDASSRLVVADPRGATPTSPPAVIWRSLDQAVPAGGTAVVRGPGGDAQLVSPVRRPDGSLDLAAWALADGGAVAAVRIGPGLQDAPFGPLVVLGRGAGSPPRIVVPIYDRVADFIDYVGADPWAGTTMAFDIARPGWGLLDGGGTGSGSAADFDGDGIDDLYWMQGYRGCNVASGASGAVVWSADCGYHGVISFVPMETDGTVGLLHTGDLVAGPARLDAELTRLWAMPDLQGCRLGAAAPTRGGRMRVGTVRNTSATFEIHEASDGDPVLAEVLAGGAAWADEAAAHAGGAVPGVLSGVVAGLDLDGSGTSGFVAGSTDGFLYAVSADDGSVLWSFNLRATVGEPTMADVNGDGRSEVVVPVGDGSVHAVGLQELAPPPAVYDTDGTFVAFSATDDLDSIASSTTVGGNWPASPEAGGYEYEILTDDDVVVAAWTDVGSATRFVRSDLALRLGQRYKTAVRAHSTGSPPRVSSEVLSDGFVVVDEDAPRADVSVVPDVIFPEEPGPASLAVVAYTATDRVALASFDLRVTDAGGAAIRALAGGATGGTDLAGETTWDGRDDDGGLVAAGDYRIALTVRDGVPRETTAEAAVLVCRADSADERCAVGPPDGGGDEGGTEDGGGEADAGHGDGGESDVPGGEPGWHPTGSGCSCRAAARPSTAGMLATLMASFVVLGWRTRRWRR
ncbi:MAG: PQQ-binding-like beta-propeller repeat protein [Deltaproteobacteria bacterium]|nr:PQQ-binding-like beta-propeller repeat protein [Deltaproteobacteria bacterium]